MNNNSKRKIIASGLSILICTTGIFTSMKLVKDSPYVDQNINASSAVSLMTTNIEDNIINSPKNSEDFVKDNIYNEYRMELTKIIQKKQFDDRTSQILYSIFYKVYQNYDVFNEINNGKNKQTKEEYINNLFSVIDNNVNYIIFVDTNNPKDEQLSNELGDAFGILITEEGKILLQSNLPKEKYDSLLLHEITHASQNKLLYLTDIDNGFKKILIEGEATCNTTNLNNTFQFNNKMALFADDMNYFISGIDSSQYTLCSKYYYMLCNLVGYDVVYSSKENFDINTIINAIESNYEIDGTELFNSMNSSLVEYNQNYNSDYMRSNICNAEKMFVLCLKQDILNISSKEQTIDMLNKYRYYKFQYSIDCIDSNNNYHDNFNYKELENLLFENILKYDVLPEDYERPIFDMLLNNINRDDPVSGKELSISNISYLINKDSIILTGKNNKTSYVYDLNTSNIYRQENNINLYNESISIIDSSYLNKENKY